MKSIIKVRGARNRVYEWDLTKLSNGQVEALLAYAFGVITQRAGAGKQGEEKFAAEEEKARELLEGRWVPGSKGGGVRIDLAEEIRREIFMDLFRALGVKKAEAAKRAKAEGRAEDYAKIRLAREHGTEALTPENVSVATRQVSEQVEAMVMEEIERRKALEGAIKLDL
jgi:hypothetical protein